MFLYFVPLFIDYFISKWFFSGLCIQSSPFLVFVDICLLLSLYFLSGHNLSISFLELPHFILKDSTYPFLTAKVLNFLPQNLLDNEKKINVNS